MRPNQRRSILFAFLCLPAAGYAQPWSDSLRATLSDIAVRHQLVGMSVYVVRNDAQLFSFSFGYADVDRDRLITDSTQYRIASISKMITTIALVQLYEQGLFRLEDDVSRYLGFRLQNPSFPNDSVTFRQLLSHTSSLRDGTGYDSFLSATYNNTVVPALQSLLVPGGAYYSANTWSSSKRPNAAYFTYSNVNFGIIGTLVECLSGERFDRYCWNHIFTPLTLAASYNVQDLPNIANVAVLYRMSGGSWAPQADNFHGVKPAPRDLSGYSIGTNGFVFAPQGGVRISAGDLAVFIRLLMNGGTVNGVRLLQDSTVTRMRQTVWSKSGANGDNYYGIFNHYAHGNHPTTDLLPGQSLFGHPGEAYGLISDMYGATDGSYAIVFMTNGSAASYQLGQYSGWYRVEEEVYNACYALGVQSPATGVAVADVLPRRAVLLPAYPNPFNPSTTLSYDLARRSFVRLVIYDLLGREAATLVNAEESPGAHRVTWDASRQAGGVYFARLQAGNVVETRKMVVVR